MSRYAAYMADVVVLSPAAARALAPLLRREAARYEVPSRLLLEVIAACQAVPDACDTARAQGAKSQMESTSPHDESDELTTAEAADMLGVTASRVRQLRDDGRLDGRQSRPGCPWRFSRSSVTAYLEEHR